MLHLPLDQGVELVEDHSQHLDLPQELLRERHNLAEEEPSLTTTTAVVTVGEEMSSWLGHQWALVTLHSDSVGALATVASALDTTQPCL